MIRSFLPAVGAFSQQVPYVPNLAQRMLRSGGKKVLAFFGGEIGSSAPQYSVIALPDAREWLTMNGKSALRSLDNLIAKLPDSEPFGCGYGIAIPYGFGPACDSAIAIPGEQDQPEFRAVRIDACIVTDEANHAAWISASPEADPSALSSLRESLESAQRMPALVRGNGAAGFPADWANLYGEMGREEYVARVRRILNAISQGDYYECNFTQRFRMASSADPADVGQTLFSAPARHSCWFDFGDQQLISVSPERFLRIADGQVVTAPIKGSARRHSDSRLDRQSQDALLGSEKDRSEHTMVVDMSRNDLGRICRTGTVKVRHPYSIEPHQHVFQMVSSIEGELENEVPISSVLAATFPPASITGTPKIAATHAIAELEVSARGFYTGALGLIGRGWMDLNVAIRTAHATRAADGFLYEFGAGGAIVADSDPESEYEECLMKARPIAEAIWSQSTGARHESSSRK
jgi:para-aminobenzoate synthetase component I